MNLRFFSSLLFLFSFALLQAGAQPKSFDKSAFYKVIENGKLEEIDKELATITASNSNEKEAFEGALLMKKSGLVAKAKNKLALFKEGRTKLENAISKDNSNTEFRFLRLIIQEHAPKVVKYRNELEKDSQLIRTNFKILSPALQETVLDYCKKSAILKIP